MSSLQRAQFLISHVSSKASLLAVVFLAGLGAALDGFGMALFLPLFESYSGEDLGGERFRLLKNGLALLGFDLTFKNVLVLLIVVFFLRVIVVYFRQVYIAHLSTQILFQVRKKVVSTCFGFSLTLFEKYSIGEVSNIVGVEAERFSNAFGTILNFVSNVLLISVLVFILAKLSVELTLVSAIAIAIAGGFLVPNFKRSSSESHLLVEAYKNFQSIFVDRINNFKLLKILRCEALEAERVGIQIGHMSNVSFLISKYKAKTDLFFDPLLLGIGGLIIYLAALFDVGLAELGLFGLIFIRLQPLARELAKSFQGFLSVTGTIDTLQAFLSQNEKIKKDVSEICRREQYISEPVSIESKITFRNIVFNYDGTERPVLSGLSLSLVRGEFVGIIGPSGSGKSTLLDVMLGLRSPSSMELIVDGENEILNFCQLKRDQFGYVGQKSLTFYGTVREFLLTGYDHKISNEHLIRCLELSNSMEFLPEGAELDFVISESGENVSGGQLQRLSLARSLVRSPTVLILDEPSSALDITSERNLNETIRLLASRENMAIVVVTHRATLLEGCDMVYVMGVGAWRDKGHLKQVLSRNPGLVN